MFRRNRDYAKIHIEYDSEDKNTKLAIVEGDEVTLASVIAAMIKNMLESGFNRELLESVIKMALEDSKKKEEKTHITEIHISKENAKDFEELLKKLMKEGK